MAARRRPVPRDWREEHHRLQTRSHAWGRGWHRVSRTKGYCSCGEKWPKGERVDNLKYGDVLNYWNDHVEDVYYREER